jgi:hypothetical protein
MLLEMLSRLFILLILSVTTLCAPFFPWKLSYIVGSLVSFFSVSNVITPLIGLFGGSGVCIIIFCLRTMMTCARYSFVHTLPGLCAGLSFSLPGYLMKVIVPGLCIFLFCIHPVGSQAILYTVYWIIPIASYFSMKKNMFFDALCATFVAHAVGSVLWLYTISSMTATLWIGLIPIVFFERLLFAGGMVMVYLFCIQLQRISMRFMSYQPKLNTTYVDV